MRQTRLHRRKRRARKQLRHTNDTVHRRAQLVAHAIQEAALCLRSLLQLTVALQQLARSQRDLRLEALLLDDHALKPDPLQARAVRDRTEYGERVGRVGPGRLPGSRVSMERQAQRRLAPDRIGIGGPDLQHVITRVEVREGDPVLRAKVDPLIRQTDHPVSEPIAARRCEVERAEIERQDVSAIVKSDAVEQPVRLGTWSGHPHDLDARQCHARRPAALGEA